MNKVERAIILAAGKGERLHPLTLKTPKPLVSVNGTVLIEGIINNLRSNSINEIHIVVGYKKEQFDYLKAKYSIHIIENPFYDSTNNISSLYAAKEFIKNSIILDGDQIINNPKILSPYFDCSGYAASFSHENTNEWLLTVDENNIIKSCSRTGGKNGWRLYSISRWDAETATKLKSHLEFEFVHNHNDQIYWDDIALFCYPEEYELGIMKIDPEDCIEIDTYDELCILDPTYRFKNE